MATVFYNVTPHNTLLCTAVMYFMILTNSPGCSTWQQKNHLISEFTCYKLTVKLYTGVMYMQVNASTINHTDKDYDIF